MTPEQFVAKYTDLRLNEVSAYVSHFNDLCALVNHPAPVEADRVGETFTFQKGVTKNEAGYATGRGFADVWHRGKFAFEYKGLGKHKDLREAYRQLQLYRESLENPPLLVVCDFERYEIHTNFQNTVSLTYAFTHADLARAILVGGSRFTALQLLQKLFHDPDALRPTQTMASVTEEAARKFAALADAMHKQKFPPAQAARFLVKLVFCLFCEDVGLLPKDLFTRIVDATRAHPREFVRHMRELFGAMAVGGRIVWGEAIPHFDGGLFADTEADPDVIEFDGEDLRRLADASKLNWADVDPSIFGTLFERALDIEGKRAQLGAHYTARADIETLVEPVLMAPLRREWEEIKAKTADYLDWQTDSPRPRQKRERGAGGEGATKKTALEQLLRDFQDKLANTTILDPACGSGNFLYVSLNLLKDLEKQVITFALSVGLPNLEPRVGPQQLHGIEKDDYAFQLASIVVWIGYLQWKARNGYPLTGETPILKPLDTIRQMDAIINLSPRPPSLTGKGEKHSPATGEKRSSVDSHPSPAQGEGSGIGVEPQWPTADVIVGNPPFLGGNKVRAELGDAYVEALFQLYEGRVPAFSDLCCYWFEKARASIESGRAKRAGLLATNSIRGGVNREVLKRIKQTGDIFWAQSDREWVLDGAAVRVSMIGFDNGVQKDYLLDDQSTPTINPDLTPRIDLTLARPLKENQGTGFRGNQKGGPFDIPADIARRMLEVPANPNSKLNMEVVRPWMNGSDITGRSRNMWLIDFGVDRTLEQAALYELPFEYIKKHVAPKYAKIKPRWWLHERPRPEMREAISKLRRFIVTPHVSKHRLFVWLESQIVPDHQLIVFARDDDYFFGVLHSKPHELWALRLGTSLEDRPRYTPTTTFETFPFPWPPGHEPKRDPRVKAIADAARELNELRENWLNPYKDQDNGQPAIREELKKRTLTNLYNARPQWLVNAHAKLDAAVFAAYGWPPTLSDDDILTRLLAENLKREAVPSGIRPDR